MVKNFSGSTPNIQSKSSKTLEMAFEINFIWSRDFFTLVRSRTMPPILLVLVKNKGARNHRFSVKVERAKNITYNHNRKIFNIIFNVELATHSIFVRIAKYALHYASIRSRTYIWWVDLVTHPEFRNGHWLVKIGYVPVQFFHLRLLN